MIGIQISYPVTRMDKGFPKLWLGGVGLTFIFCMLADDVKKWSLLIIFVLFIGGLYYFNKTVWDIADEVKDYGEYLSVSKSGVLVDIPFTNISRIGLTYTNHKHLITIKLYKSCPLGDSITFRAHEGYPTFRTPKILNELKSRVNCA
jgi:hypothetical protein